MNILGGHDSAHNRPLDGSVSVIINHAAVNVLLYFSVHTWGNRVDVGEKNGRTAE